MGGDSVRGLGFRGGCAPFSAAAHGGKIG
jgi:hypothetical protein